MIQVAGRDMRSIIERHMPKLSPELDVQLDYHCNILYALNSRLHRKRPNFAREIEFLRWAYASFLASRNNRIDELRSQDIQEVNEIKESMLPYQACYFWLCVDSRVGAKLYGFHRRALRFPAGETNEFYYNNRGELCIHSSSRIARIIFDEFEKLGSNVHSEVIESHIDCAKRAEIEEQIHLSRPADSGLYYDVVRKKLKIKALNKLLFDEYKGTKRLFVTHTSADPKNGYSYVGLDRVLRDPLVKAQGFTKEVLHNLVREGKIVSAYHLVEGDHVPAIKALFKQYRFEVDFEGQYVSSTVQLWEALRDMAEDLIPLFEKALSGIFPSTNDSEYYKELRQRAILLMANAFTAYLLNSREEGYPYAEHKEEIIVVTYNGDRGPFDVMIPFSNDPSSPDLSDDIFFTDFLIRKNRLAGRMSSKTRAVIRELGFTLEEFANAPVPLVTFERVKQVYPDIALLQQANWADLLDIPWMSNGDNQKKRGKFDFQSYVRDKLPGVTLETSSALSALRDRMKYLYQPGTKAAQRLWAQDTVPLPIIADNDRRALSIVSFNRIGCDQSYFVH